MANLNNQELENVVGGADLDKESLFKMPFEELKKRMEEMAAKIKSDEDEKRKKIEEMLLAWKECNPDLFFPIKEKVEEMLKQVKGE